MSGTIEYPGPSTRFDRMWDDKCPISWVRRNSGVATSQEGAYLRYIQLFYLEDGRIKLILGSGPDQMATLGSFLNSNQVAYQAHETATMLEIEEIETIRRIFPVFVQHNEMPEDYAKRLGQIIGI